MAGTVAFIVFLVSLIWPVRLLWKRYVRQQEIATANWIAAFSLLGMLNIGWMLFRSIGIGLYIEKLWFDEVAQSAIFWKRMGMPWFLGIAAFVAAYLVMTLGLRPFTKFTARLHAEEGAENSASAALLIIWSARIVSLAVAFFTGLFAAEHWLDVLLYLNRQPSGVVDPVFDRDIVFYFFSLPIWQTALSYTGMISLVLLAATYAYTNLIHSAVVSNVYDRNSNHHRALDRIGKRRAGIFASLTLATYAANIYLARYGLLTKSGSLFSGPHYVDMTAGIKILTFEAITLLALAILVLADGFAPFLRNLIVDDPSQPGWQPRRKALAAIAIITLLFGTVRIAVPWYKSRIVSQGNAIQIESPYMMRNIEATRRAFGITPGAQMEERDYHPIPFSRDIIDKDSDTLQNIRVADWRALHPTLNQDQLLRKYYAFPDVDIDRYEVDGKMRQVMLSAREINLDTLPEAAKTWVNVHFIYTHGYGLAVVPVNSFTSEGLPNFLAKDMPYRNISGTPSLEVARPQIYYGENTNEYAYGNTNQPELDHALGEDNVHTKYDGKGGIRIANAFRRFVLALEFDGWKMYVSPLVTNETKLMYRRIITERISHIAPFLTLDGDPYLVVSDGKLYWIIDAYTTTNRYPYSTSYQFWNSQQRDGSGNPAGSHGAVNYVRNSVKVVVDAYDGAVDFYLMDPTDPLVQAYSRIFPSLFKAKGAMPEGIRGHLRYPEDLLYLQSRVLAVYHMSKPETFYNREDEWTIGREKIAVEKGSDSVEVIPYFVSMSLPGSNRREFVLMQPFTPAKRQNLIAWMAGRSDWDNYGKLMLLKFPKGTLTSGPLQAELRIDTEDEFSQNITLWNKEGSEVIRGNLLIIPFAKSLIYVEPLYLKSSGEQTMPKLIRVIVGAHLHAEQQELTLAWAPTFREALEKLLAGSRYTPAPTPTKPGQPTEPKGEPDIVKELRRLLDEIEKFCGENPTASICK